MNNLDAIYAAAYSLANQGKTPSVALIKAKVGTATPLALIIKGLKAWQSNPQLGKDQQTDINDESKALAPAANNELNRALAPLVEQIADLNQQVASLTQTIHRLEQQLLK